MEPRTHRRFRAGYYAFLLLSLSLLGLVGYSYLIDFRRATRINGELAALQGEVASLQSRKVELQDLLSYFDSESYAESRARLDFGLAKPGEKVIVVTPAPGETRHAPGGQPEAGPSGQRPVTPIRAWWAYFFGRGPGIAAPRS